MKLLEPFEINGMQLQNRVIFLATHLGYCGPDGNITDRVIEFYRERAIYRPGLIIVGGCYTEHFGKSGPTMIGLSYAGHKEGHQKLVQTIHDCGVPVAAQLYHAGRYSNKIFIGDDPVSASSVPSRLFKSTPRPLTIQEIQGTINNFGLAAKRAIKCGYDAVEVIGSAGYLINQFLAKATNKRTDEYNGDLKARARFAIEVVESIREYVGEGFPILYRISGDDFIPDGTTLEDNKKLAPWLVQAGVDCFNVTGGWHETRVPQITMDVPRGHFVFLAEELAEIVDVPVVACNRINSPTLAEKILQRGKADLIGLSRGFIADSEFVEKIRTDRTSEIRHCIACNIGCLDNVFKLEPVICAINPFAGFESERAIRKDGKGKIAVVGAGPAGMEAARILSLRGFDVTLFEKESRIGGLLNLLSKVPLRGEYATYVSDMRRELLRLKVEITVNHEVSLEDFEAGDYDIILLATGTIAGAPPIDGVEGPHVTSAFDVLATGIKDPGNVSVIGNGSIACHAALFMAGISESVTLFVLDSRAGNDIGKSTRWVILKGLKERGVKIHLNAQISQITSKYVMHTVGDVISMIETDTVVVAANPVPRTRLLEKINEAGLRVECVGSMKKKMNLLECIHDAFTIANEIEI